MRKGQAINMKKRLCEKYGKKMAVMVFSVMLVMTVCLAGCGNAAPADPSGSYVSEVSAGEDGSGETAPKENESLSHGGEEQDADSRSAEAEREAAPGAGEVVDDADESGAHIAGCP